MSLHRAMGCRRLRRLVHRASFMVLLCLPARFAIAENLHLQQALLPMMQAATMASSSTTLELGGSIEHELAGGETHTYLVSLAEGQYLKVLVDQRGIDVSLKSFDPSDHPIAVADLENRPEGTEKAELVARAAGLYKIKVEGKYKSLPAGSYTIHIEELRAATDAKRELQEARELYTEAFDLIVDGKYSDCEEAAQRVLAIRERLEGPDHPEIALTLTLLANVAYYKNDFAKSELLNQRAIAMLEKTLGRDHPQAATRLNNLGSVYEAKGDFVRAELTHKRALEIRERALSPNHPDIAQSLNNLANVYLDLGDHVSAEPLYLRAIAINEKVLGPDHPALAYPLVNLGIMHMENEDFDQAQAYFERAMAIREAKLGKDHPALALVLQNLAELYVAKQEYTKAQEIATRALEIWQTKVGPETVNVGRSYHTLGSVYTGLKDYAQAESYLLRALAIEDKALGPFHPDTLSTVAYLAQLYITKGDVSKGLIYMSRVLDGHDRNIDLNLAIGSERQKQAYLASLPPELDRAISLHVDFAPNNSAARDLAITSILRRKGRVLDAMAQSFAALRSRMPAENRAILDRLSETTVELARLVLNGPQRLTLEEHRERIKTAEAEREKLEIEISHDTAGYYQPSQPVTLAAVRSTLPADAVLIEIAVYRPFNPALSNENAYGEPHYVAYVIRPQEGVQWKELGPVKEIDDAVDGFRRALRNRGRTDVRQRARDLDRRLMQPLRPFLEGCHRLLVSPDGELSLIPFEALVDEQGRYLIETYSLSYLTSGRDLLRMQVPRETMSRPVVVANPLYGEPGLVPAGKSAAQASVTTAGSLSDIYFAPLSGTSEEAAAIRELFPEARLLTGIQATKKALHQIEAPPILHIATHGFFLLGSTAQGASPSSTEQTPGATIENPLLRSGLALAGANHERLGNNEGILTALEASTLNLWGTKLVTLSACDTGVGAIKDHDGVYGLRRSFFLAGTESLVMSLWPVSDYVTREMMMVYYRGLKSGLGRGEALRQAQLATLKRKARQHPYYWAGFIESGEWANLDGKR